jgi:hypothetical protein
MRLLTFFLALFAFTQSAHAFPYDDVDDRLIRITSAARADAVRAQLRNLIWGTTTLPSTLPAESTASSSPMSGLGGLYAGSVKILDVVYGCEVSRAYYFQAASPNGTLMVLHEGHDAFSAAAIDDVRGPGNDSTAGRQRFVRALLQNGYSVILAFMPHYRPYVQATGTCTAEVPDHWPNGPAGPDRNHEWMFDTLGTHGEVLKYFLDPVVQWVNYAATRQNGSGGALFSRIVMAGLSGGGWTTTVAAAIDPRIVRSYPVAGSLPLYMRECMSKGDDEQVVDSLYEIAGYLDLYLLGTYPGRKQIQILLRHDIYFGDAPALMYKPANVTWEALLRPYEAAVRSAAHALGSAPSFRIEIDEGAAGHTYSRNAAFNVILGDLNEDRREVGAVAETHLLLRGADGEILQRTSGGWASTGRPASGTPAVVENAAGAQRTDLFYRDETNVLRHVHRTNGAWSAPATLSLPGAYRALGDPVAVATPDGIDIVAVAAEWKFGPTVKTPCPLGSPNPFNEPTSPYRSNYDVFHWTWTPSGGLSAATQLTQNGQVLSDPNENGAPVGVPAVVRFNNQLHVFVRAENAVLYHIKQSGSTWVAAPVSALLTAGFPTAVVANNAMRVYTRSLGNALYEFSGTGSTWTASTVPVAMTGSPAAIVTSTDVKVFVRGLDGKITACTRPVAGTQWTVTSLGGSAITGSPAVTPGGVVAGAHKSTPETAVRHNGTAWSSFVTTEAVPVTFTATVAPSSTTTINLTWTASSSDAGNTFVVERSAGSGFERVATVTGTSYNDTVTANQSYVYRVRSATSWAFKADLATAKNFSDIAVRGAIRADDLRNARSATNMARVAAGLSPVTFIDPAKARVLTTDVTTLRTYLTEALQAAGLAVPSFTTIPTRGSVLRSHFIELTNAVK